MICSVRLLAVCTALLVASSAWADTQVSGFDAAYTTDGVWYLNDMRDNGTATIQNLTGLGGDLENNQPLPISAARLTTDFANNDKADVAVINNYGLASSVLTALDLTYEYYKQTVAGGNVFAAPSIKLAIFASGGTGDNFGQLIYEPYINPCCGAVPTDAWQSVSIGPNTGSGNNASGGWWWTGGFELPNGAGGPPYRSLAEWATAFAAADPVDFPTAVVFQVGMGVGTFNQGQIGYFDDVNITNTLADACYDFELEPPTPVEGTTWGAIKSTFDSD